MLSHFFQILTFYSAVPNRKKSHLSQIASSDECADDIAQICSGRRLSNDIDTLACLNDRDAEVMLFFVNR